MLADLPLEIYTYLNVVKRYDTIVTLKWIKKYDYIIEIITVLMKAFENNTQFVEVFHMALNADNTVILVVTEIFDFDFCGHFEAFIVNDNNIHKLKCISFDE